MKKLLTVLTPLALIGVAGATPANAAVIAGWNQFLTGGATYPVAADTSDGNISTTGLDTANIQHLFLPAFGLGGAGTASDGSSGSWNTGATVDLSQYLEFQVEANAGFEMDFSNLQLNAQMDETNLDLVLRSSIDGFTSDLGSINLTGSFATYTLDLSSLAPQTGPVQFRFYGINADTDTVFFIAENSANVDGGGFVAINGDVNPIVSESVPEPSSIISLIALGALGVASRRRLG
ncbi:PEP-CTERM sorting domain-containing protein [Crocosphaera sp. UHCC 0190]|uniref:PEP-CTERM sorting domain-containing protein n=1 Tax=Crocosphaera sp. UHCC 0190 TaxID=3110246 RepID=UPI002B1EAA59|nr:PEP-CTERM sorting domain-containing protein [Crocosphaera sp. UHCC 0190]MEA5511089.1 PEP-CTERM sorting domain-containing protein [Crocosphaera sp. UHCC 0190]